MDIRHILAAVVLAVSAQIGTAAEELPNYQASAVIQHSLESSSIVLVPMNLWPVQRAFGYSKSECCLDGAILSSYYDGILDALAAANLVVVTEGTAWQEFRVGKNPRMRRDYPDVAGLLTAIYIAPGPAMADEPAEFDANGQVFAKLAEYAIVRIVRNEEISIGARIYRRVSSLYNVTWSKIGSVYNRELYGFDQGSDFKGRFLLEYDEFASRWLVVASDTAPELGPFTTRNVP